MICLNDIVLRNNDCILTTCSHLVPVCQLKKPCECVCPHPCVGSDSDSEEEESTSLLMHGDNTNDNDDDAGDHLIMSEKSSSLTGTLQPITIEINVYYACEGISFVK